MTTAAILPQSVYRRAIQPHELQKDLRLTALEWALYFAATGTHTSAELGRQLRAGNSECAAALARLAGERLIEEQQLDAAEYMRALAAAGDQMDRSLHEFLMGAAGGLATTAINDPHERSVASAQVRVRPVPNPGELTELADTPAPAPRTARIASPLEFRPLPPPEERKENRPMTVSRKLSLRALMNLIEAKAGSRDAGQLDVYRVFVRVDTTLLKRSGIETLRFTEDRLVSDPELEQAIVRSVKKTLGLECPESVWVDVA